jgi:membrane protease YdiL (CAAX protease family)
VTESAYLAYAARGRNAAWRYVLAFAVAIVLAIVVGMAVLVPLQLAGISGDLSRSLMNPTDAVPFFLSNGAIFLFLILGFVLAARWIHGKRFTDLLGRWRWRDYGVGLAIWTLVVIAASLIDYAIAPRGFRFLGGQGLAPVAAAALVGLAVQTFAEELVFRGYLTQGLLLALRRPLPTAVVSGLLFGAMHIPNGWPHAASATVTGVAMALIAIRTGGIAFTSGMHLANNLYAAVVVVSAGDAFKGSPGLFAQDTPQLMWWDTGVGAVALIGLTVVILREKKPVMVNEDGA